MSKQYFDNDVKLEDDPHTLTYYGETELTFKTNSGMFSKDKLDYYSIVLIENVLEDGPSTVDSYLDLGCGYGFIGISLASKYPQARKVFIDITQRAVDYTKTNIDLNHIENTEVILSDGIKVEETFDLITLNPPIHAGKQVMYQLYDDAYNHLNENGEFYIVLHKKHGALSTIKDLESKFKNIDIIYKKKGLYVLKLKK